jgi:uncharacterized membrane protein YphA (DoxX/SURF4 family)
MTIDPVIVLILRFGLAWLFLAAAAHKLRSGANFRVVLATYRVMPGWLVPVAAWLIVVVELAIGAGALMQYPRAFAAAALVLIGYASVIGLNLARGRRFIDCGCGGTTQPLSVGLLIRNVVLALGALVALSPTLLRPLGWLDIFSVVVGSAVLGGIYAAVNELLAARARLEEWV